MFLHNHKIFRRTYKPDKLYYLCISIELVIYNILSCLFRCILIVIIITSIFYKTFFTLTILYAVFLFAINVHPILNKPCLPKPPFQLAILGPICKLPYAINRINEAFTVSSLTDTYNMVVSGFA